MNKHDFEPAQICPTAKGNKISLSCSCHYPLDLVYAVCKSGRSMTREGDEKERERETKVKSFQFTFLSRGGGFRKDKSI